MQKLIETFANNPTEANAKKVVAHVKKHPMATCALSFEYIQWLNMAEMLAIGEGE